MEKVKVIFRKEYNEYTKEWEVIAFFPEFEVRYGNIVCYRHIGQHGTADILYYHTTKKASPDEYAELFKELKSVYYDCELVVKQRLNYRDLDKAWDYDRRLCHA